MKLAIVLRAMYVLNTFAVGFKCFEKKKKKKESGFKDAATKARRSAETSSGLNIH